MLRHFRTGALGLFLATLGGILSSCSTQSDLSPGPTPTTINIPQPEAGKALIVFYRPRITKGATIRFDIYEAGRPIGQLNNGRIIRHTVTPGNHTFAARSPSAEGVEALMLTAKAGETYFVKGDVTWGWPAGRPKFTKVSPAKGQREIANLAL